MCVCIQAGLDFHQNTSSEAETTALTASPKNLESPSVILIAPLSWRKLSQTNNLQICLLASSSACSSPHPELFSLDLPSKAHPSEIQVRVVLLYHAGMPYTVLSMHTCLSQSRSLAVSVFPSKKRRVRSAIAASLVSRSSRYCCLPQCHFRSASMIANLVLQEGCN